MPMIHRLCVVSMMQHSKHILVIALNYGVVRMKIISTQLLFYKKVIPIDCHAWALDHKVLRQLDIL